MPPQSSAAARSPLLTLAAAFLAWKALILLLAYGALVGSDYDTSTALLLPSSRATSLARRLTRWDAVYFVHGARDGHVYEQEWAFSPALALVLRWLAALGGSGSGGGGEPEALAAIALAHASHGVAVGALHRLTLLLSGGPRLALLTALLCVVSPAGVFLSAPYAEAPFSALSFVGVYLLAAGYTHRRGSAPRAVAVVAAGAVLGLATAVRTNGLASGLLFAVEGLQALRDLVRAPGGAAAAVLAAAAAGLGGVLVALGSVIPQYVAFTIYCTGPEDTLRPPWCEYTVPSIYSYVQDVYWNVGFLRYWTPNQIPLFILAAPVLTLLMVSGWQVLRAPASGGMPGKQVVADHRTLVRALAASQGIVALLALTSYHVQVISRLASGYAVWYWWIAACLMDKARLGTGRAAVMFMVMYAGIQAVLFATFLPPA
ncbi:DUF409 domain protein [Cordyceps militaris CM01]|uniref:GPI mannosyltransferase 2 n=1 Tax=Cordyceps militaris (strain CM01) TaxID=983644 RepID=G3J3M0_CORMM|nr:DUF409 domain protein [Cordyceps militaris CM01]EGX95696.1 DUF409 domain protein [Cordyceps militaris CM01]